MDIAKRLAEVAPSATLEISAKAKKMAKSGIDVISFGAGEPDFDTPRHIKEAAIKAIDEGVTKYTPSSGTPELRDAIAKKLKSDNSLDYEQPQIVVSCGAKHSLYNIFQAICNEGDEVIIPSPYWLSYPEMVRMAGAKPVYAGTEAENSFKLTESALRSVITGRTRALVLNSPSNPTGCVYDKTELGFIAGLAVKHKFFVISDEIYEKLIYDGKKHISIASLGKDIYDLTFTVNGLSKSYSMTGWRIGYAAGPKDLMGAISNLQSHATSNPASMCQAAALAALTGDQECVARMREEFEKRRDAMVGMIGLMRGISCIKPEGAFYVFCDISKTGMGSMEVATRLLEEAKVAVVPGTPFGSDRFIRLSFATGMEKIEKGLTRIKGWIEKYG
ncbi:MAG: pyridoxal phosphate-dependent aminotransferase [Candidatus Omnitrophota bacterium]